MTPGDWVAMLGIVTVNLGLVWRFTLKVERRLTRIEAKVGID